VGDPVPEGGNPVDSRRHLQAVGTENAIGTRIRAAGATRENAKGAVQDSHRSLFIADTWMEAGEVGVLSVGIQLGTAGVAIAAVGPDVLPDSSQLGFDSWSVRFGSVSCWSGTRSRSLSWLRAKPVGQNSSAMGMSQPRSRPMVNLCSCMPILWLEDTQPSLVKIDKNPVRIKGSGSALLPGLVGSPSAGGRCRSQHFTEP